MLVAEVILPLPLPGTFSYAVPEELTPHAKAGHRVVVSFGRSKFLTGVILETEDRTTTRDLKPILETLDETPIVLPYQFEFMKWMASYYMCSLGEVLQAALPSGFKLSSESLVTMNPLFDIEEGILTEEEIWLLRRLQEKDVPVQEIHRITGIDHPLRFIKSLQQRGIIHIIEKVREKYTPRTERRVRLHTDYLSEDALDHLLQKLEKSPKQVDVLVSYLTEVPIIQNPAKNENGIAKSQLVASGVSPSSVKTLINNGVLEEWNEVVDRFAAGDDSGNTLPDLTPSQELALQQVVTGFQQNKPVLLKGVTGSGKTAVYMKLVEEVINNGSQVLLLLPEIALTTQIIGRFRAVFGHRFGVFHSKFSDNERVEVWKKCLKGEFDFVIGVRSALFLPMEKLSLVIVDEEHETSYKQQDPAPRYNARDASVYLSHLKKANVLLGSATPSFESYTNALEGKYHLVELTDRYNQLPPPPMHLVDMSREKKKKLLKGSFSSVLLEAIRSAIDDGQQALLFQNRRGYAPFLLCDNCSHSPKCPNCSVSLTYHIYKNVLTCHYCGYHESMVEQCDNCMEGTFRTIGIGTEKIEEELQILLPDLQIQRMDLDSTRSKYAYQDIIDRFEQKQIDVLVGTQMISKGLDFDDVALVGVFDADRMIHFPDFRSHERAFHLITQVGGRAGRKEKQGIVLIQTNDPDQRVLRQIQQMNYEGFYQDQLRERRNFRYPPYYRLISITIRHKEKNVAREASDQLSFVLRKNLNDMASHTIEPIVSKIRNFYRYQIMIRLPKEQMNLAGAKQFLQSSRDTLLALPAFKSVRIHFDVDPL